MEGWSPQENAIWKAAALATSSPFGVGGAYFHYGNQGKWVDTVYLGAWPKTIFQTYGLFDEEMVRDQDDEFNYRLRSQGGRIWFNPDIYATYTPRASFAKLFKQYYQYGFWKVRVLQKHPKQMSLRQFVPPTFVLALLVAGLLSFTFSWGWYALVFLIGVYLLANLFASLCRQKPKPQSFFPSWHLPPSTSVTASAFWSAYSALRIAGMTGSGGFPSGAPESPGPGHPASA